MSVSEGTHWLVGGRVVDGIEVESSTVVDSVDVLVRVSGRDELCVS